MKTFILFFILTIFFSCSENKSNNELLSFEVRLAESMAHPDLVEMTMLNSEFKVFVSDSVFLKNDHISSTEIIDWETHPKVMVYLTDEGGKIFADFTQANIGKKAAILVGGKLVSAPRINAPIMEGKLIIAGLFEHEEAQKIAQGIVP